MTIKSARIVIVFALFIAGCDSFFTADFEIVSKEFGTKSYGNPYVLITVKNIGRGTGYNVSCDVQAKRGGVIIDSGFAYFAGGGDITSGERASDEAIFFKLRSHREYDSLEYNLSWLDQSTY